ncbi:hypothetical protein Mlab_0926 [Methanocorpusculum labreanum Z]|uniref:NERD domain-containing protein n=1 Tax=Methanocorpusculum labreanum (strain ATCC 43576 / DSM 4855 / Z) TaxID=410358 RepID=A2SRZ1_METLZ|nr:hypothetical protein [Methanocorpusculum labreanum]ABN07097.1 hypothetical protein Mlab_0926 [Methanocorpusculum labreanum Z]
MTEYQYTIHLSYVNNEYWEAYSPQFPVYVVGDIDKKMACSILIEVLISVVTQYLWNDQELPLGYNHNIPYLKSLKGKRGINILPILVDEEKELGHAGLLPSQYGFLGYYLPKEYLFSKKGWNNRVIQNATLNDHSPPIISERDVFFPKPSLNISSLPNLLPIHIGIMKEEMLSLIQEYNPELKIGASLNGLENVNKFVKWATDATYQRLHNLIAQYPIRDILAWTVSQHELIAYLFTREYYEMEDFDYTKSSILSIFTEHYTQRDQLKTELEHSIQHLIEISIAENPTGNHPISSDDYCRLLANAVLFTSIRNIMSQINFLSHNDLSKNIGIKFTIRGIVASSYPLSTEWTDFRMGHTKDVLTMRNRKYKAYSPKLSISEKEKNEFETAFYDEFGLTFNEFNQFNSCLLSLPIRPPFCFCICFESQLCQKLIADYGWTKEKGLDALNLFSLQPRGAWDQIDSNKIEDFIKIEDHYHKYSYYSHPILRIPGENGENELVIGIRSWNVFVTDFLLYIQHGGYDAKSDRMNKWISRFRNLEGKAFEMAVENWFKKNTTFVVRRALKPKEIIKGRADIGDIDIGLADLNNSIFYSIECKNYLSPHEMKKIEDLNYKFSRKEINKTPAYKHQRRHKWLCSHQKEVKEYFGYTSPPQIISLFIVSHDGSPSHFDGMIFPVIPFSDLMNTGQKCLEHIAMKK